MRLIDADAVVEAIRDETTEAKGIDADPNFTSGLKLGLAYINTAPTVIEVVDVCPSDWDSPEDEIYDESDAPTVDAVPRWIPCEERLPEPNVAVLGYAPEFNNIFAVYYDSVCGWMIWSPVYDETFPGCQGEIVAWMPLPEPYREREGEQPERSSE